MEIGEQHVDRPESIAGRDEDRRLAGKRADGAVGRRGAFENAQARGADGDDAPARARAPRSAPSPSSALDLAPFGVHSVIAPCPPP